MEHVITGFGAHRYTAPASLATPAALYTVGLSPAPLCSAPLPTTALPCGLSVV